MNIYGLRNFPFSECRYEVKNMNLLSACVTLLRSASQCRCNKSQKKQTSDIACVYEGRFIWNPFHPWQRERNGGLGCGASCRCMPSSSDTGLNASRCHG